MSAPTLKATWASMWSALQNNNIIVMQLNNIQKNLKFDKLYKSRCL